MKTIAYKCIDRTVVTPLHISDDEKNKIVKTLRLISTITKKNEKTLKTEVNLDVFKPILNAEFEEPVQFNIGETYSIEKARNCFYDRIFIYKVLTGISNFYENEYYHKSQYVDIMHDIYDKCNELIKSDELTRKTLGEILMDVMGSEEVKLLPTHKHKGIKLRNQYTPLSKQYWEKVEIRPQVTMHMSENRL